MSLVMPVTVKSHLSMSKRAPLINCSLSAVRGFQQVEALLRFLVDGL